MAADTPEDAGATRLPISAGLARRGRRAARSDRHTGSLGRNLPMAIASGLVMAVLFFGTLFLSSFAFVAFIAVLATIGLFELDAALRTRGLRPATPVAAASGLVMLFGALSGGPAAQSLGLVLLVLGALAWALLDPGSRQRRAGPPGAQGVVGNVGATCLMALWVPFLASFSGLLLLRADGRWYVMAAVALAVTNDIGAFAFGNRFGRHKLAPGISPGKTWEGFAGGVLTVLLLAGLVTARVPGFDLPTALLVGLGVAVAGTLGDLAESLVKRDLGVKDLGRLIPGHGGIMDRVDAIVFALPTAHLVLLALGV